MSTLSNVERIRRITSEHSKTAPKSKRAVIFTIENLFPLPTYPDPSLCRDAFLKEHLKSFEYELASVAEELDDVKGKSLDLGEVKNVEDMLFRMEDKHHHEDESEERREKRLLLEEMRAMVPDIEKILISQYEDLFAHMGKMSIIFLLKELKCTMLVMREAWPGNVNELPFRMFSWVHDDYYRRFDQPNTLYLDILERSMATSELDCLKFRMDLGEIVRLIEKLMADIINDRELCENFLQHAKLIRTDIQEILEAPRASMYAEHTNMVINLFQYKKGKRDSGMERKYRNLRAEMVHMEYLEPVEHRYYINWIYNVMEQANIDQVKNKSEELKRIKQLTMQDKFVFQCCIQRYTGIIEEYRQNIIELQTTYDEDLEIAENEVQRTRNLLQKARDDLKFYQDQIITFHIKIARVREIIAEEEAIEALRVAKMKEAFLARTEQINAKAKGKAKGKGKGNQGKAERKSKM